MNLTLDIGNTATKWASFEGRTLTGHGYGMPEELLSQAAHVMVCASGDVGELQAKLATLRVPFATLTPQTPCPYVWTTRPLRRWGPTVWPMPAALQGCILARPAW